MQNIQKLHDNHYIWLLLLHFINDFIHLIGWKPRCFPCVIGKLHERMQRYIIGMLKNSF